MMGQVMGLTGGQQMMGQQMMGQQMMGQQMMGQQMMGGGQILPPLLCQFLSRQAHLLLFPKPLPSLPIAFEHHVATVRSSKFQMQSGNDTFLAF